MVVVDDGKELEAVLGLQRPPARSRDVQRSRHWGTCMTHGPPARIQVLTAGTALCM